MKSTQTTGALRANSKALALTHIIVAGIKSAMPSLTPILSRKKISFQQSMFLRHVAAREDANELLTMTRAAQWYGHSTAAATGQTDRLEKLGLVQRANQIGDRRKSLVRITFEGRATIAALDEAVLRFLSDTFGESLERVIVPSTLLRLFERAEMA